MNVSRSRRNSKNRAENKPQPKNRQPSQKESQFKLHKRSQSQNSELPSRSSTLNLDNQNSIQGNFDMVDRKKLKRSNSRDNLTKWYGKVAFPIVKTGIRTQKTRPNTFLNTPLEIVEDQEEINSSSKATNSLRRSNTNEGSDGKLSKEFFKNDDEHDIEIHIDNDSYLPPQEEVVNPLFTNNKAAYERQESDLSALNIDENQFNQEEDNCDDVMEVRDSFYSKLNQNPNVNVSQFSHNDKDASKNISGIMNDSDLSFIRNSKTKQLYLEGIETIHEDNENSSSVNHDSVDYSQNFSMTMAHKEHKNVDKEHTSPEIDPQEPGEDFVDPNIEQERFGHLEIRKDDESDPLEEQK